VRGSCIALVADSGSRGCGDAAANHRERRSRQVIRLLDLLADIATDEVLKDRVALKGGAALNVFYLKLDRLSVDIGAP